MTRKDFELIAAAIKDARPVSKSWRLSPEVHNTKQDAIDNVAFRMANALSTTNPRFNRERFMDACGVTNERLPLPEAV